MFRSPLKNIFNSNNDDVLSMITRQPTALITVFWLHYVKSILYISNCHDHAIRNDGNGVVIVVVDIDPYAIDDTDDDAVAFWRFNGVLILE